MTWEHHLYGSEEHRGLIPKLSQRAGIIRKLSFIMPKDKLKTIAEGIFFSLMNYCIEIFSNFWGLETYDEVERHSTAFCKEDNSKLQILMNKVLRSLTGMDRDTPVSALTAASGQLSVHQRTALFTLTSVHKAIKSKEPSYSFAEFCRNQPPLQTGRQQSNCSRIEYKLSISRGGYFTGEAASTSKSRVVWPAQASKLSSRKQPNNGSETMFLSIPLMCIGNRSVK